MDDPLSLCSLPVATGTLPFTHTIPNSLCFSAFLCTFQPHALSPKAHLIVEALSNTHLDINPILFFYYYYYYYYYYSTE